MKPAITITTAILVCILTAGGASAQNPSVVQNTRNTMNGVSQNATAASNDALGIQQPPVHRTAPAPAKSSGAAVVTPTKSSAHPAVANTVGTKRVLPSAVRHSVQPKPVAMVLQSKPQGAATLVGGAPGSGENGTTSEQSVAEDGKSSANGRRDPFISPVVSHAGGPGCSVGKKCLEIGTINLRGVVHAESGFIAVVSNGLNKAYFLRENDPVFNGYVMRITGDSIVFQETLQDRLGKTFTREVVKKITAPAV
jgi:hypothetical protein